jgi:hypothetical protein
MKVKLGLGALAIAAAVVSSHAAIALGCNTEGHAKDGLVEAIRAHPGLSSDIWWEVADSDL